MSHLAFDHPRFLWLAPVIVGALVLAMRRTLVDVSPLRRAVQLMLRCALVLAVLVAVAGPTYEGPAKGRSVVAVLDRSVSVSPDARAAALRHLQALRAARGHDDRLSVVAFAGRAVRVPLADDAPAEAPMRLPPATLLDENDTDIESALRLASGLSSPGRVPSILLYSDGNETGGRAASVAQELARRGVPIDVVVAAADPRPDVWVSDIAVPGEVRPNARFDVSADVYSTFAQHAVVTLYRGDFVNPLDGRKELDLPVGHSTVRWKSEVPKSGMETYSARISGATANQVADNDRAAAITIARGDPRVLLIEGGAGGGALAPALAKEHIDVETRAPSGMPNDAAALNGYELVALSDVAATQIGPAQSAALERYVDGGGGLLFIGGENVTEGWTGTRVEKMLPVRFDKERRKEEAQLALALAIDRSGSMDAEGRLELAKEAAKATAEKLGPDDLITVIAFDSVAQPIVRLQRAANRLRISTDISRLRAGGGTAILPALREAYTALSSAQAKVKHVILLTDGQASYDGINDLVDEMVAHRITVSAVGVGGEADRSLLTTIAQRGQGRFYFTRDAEGVPTIFLKETNEIAKRSLLEDPTGVRIARGAELFAGTGVESAPPLLGYVPVRAKPGGEVLLVSSRGDPLLARRRDGLGQTAVWASDAKSRWAVDWLRWPGFARFFAQVIRSTMRAPLAGAGAYPIEVALSPSCAVVSIDATGTDDRFVSGLAGEAEVSEPNGASVRAVLVERAPGRYEATVPLARPGPRILRTVLRRDGIEVSRSLRALTLPASRERLANTPDENLLASLRQGGNGRLAPAPSDVFATRASRPQDPRYRRALWPALLWAALALLLLDLVARRAPVATPRKLRAKAA